MELLSSLFSQWYALENDVCKLKASRMVDVALNAWTNSDATWSLRMGKIFEGKYPNEINECWNGSGISTRRYKSAKITKNMQLHTFGRPRLSHVATIIR